jgi:hypothetical protein
MFSGLSDKSSRAGGRKFLIHTKKLFAAHAEIKIAAVVP